MKRTFGVVVMVAVTTAFLAVPGGPATAAPAGAPAGASTRSDFNGDGFADLAVAAPQATVNNQHAAGEVNVIYGSANGLTPAGDQLVTQESQGVSGDAGDLDLFGSALAAGDFNNDGFADLAIGVSGESVNGFDNAGGVNVIYGSSSGLSTASRPGTLWTQDSNAVEDQAEEGDRFGTALAAGDFDDDGYADLVISAPFEDLDTIANAGAVTVVYGSSRGLSPIATPDQFWTQQSPYVEDTPQRGDQFGSALAAANFNGDAWDDLAIGVGGEEVSGLALAGAVNVLYGSQFGISAVGTLNQLWHLDQPNVDNTAHAQDFFGSALAAGDFNADGRFDLAIGVWGRELGGLQDAGYAHVIYGSASGLSPTAVLPDKVLIQGLGLKDVFEEKDMFGTALAAGRFGTDGYWDLAMGGSWEDLDALSDAGAVNVVYGTASGLDAYNVEDQFVSQGSGGVEDHAESGDHFGWALSGLDFNGDGRTDLAIGVPNETPNGSSLTAAGQVHVIYGGNQRLSTSFVPDQAWNQDTTGIVGQAGFGEFFGQSLPS